MYYTRTIAQILEEFDLDPATGLSDDEAKVKLQRDGPNKLKQAKKKSAVQIFFTQLNDALIYVLLGAVIITLFMQEYIDAVIILMVVFINAILGVAQEIKAGNAIDALKKLSAPKALVKRGGDVKEIPSDQVVPGDILLLEAGRFVAADLRLIESANLQIDESALTGEAVAASKDARQLLSDQQTPLGDRINTAFMSTLVTYGRGVGVAVNTGMQTEVGKIATLIDQEKETKTPLEIRLNALGKTLGQVAVGICSLMFILGLLQGRDLVDMLLISVSLAVASIPEGLAAIVAIVLSIGVTAMAKRNAIVKRLLAVETLGSVNIVCSDKTGTLTQNKMTVTHYFNLKEGERKLSHSNEREPSDEAILLAKAMILSSDATYEHNEGTGDPTEIALLVMGDKLGVDRKLLKAKNARLDEFAFDSDRKLMSTLEKDDNSLRVFTKGAIESLIARCNRIKANGEVILLTENHRSLFAQATERLSARALRTLAAAYKPVEAPIPQAEMETDLILLGMVGMIDPPRPEAKAAIQKASYAGITTIMITGDHQKTAFAIAQELGIADTVAQVISGEDLNRHEDEHLTKIISRYRVFARVSPEHKVKIVRAFKANGNIVSMTGDGVNDAPSLRAADIGVAMGITGTDVARTAANMILTDDNFSTIISAIEQGRNIYNNIKKSVIFLLASNTGEVVSMVVCILFGLPAPLLATQLLWINLLTDTLPAVALGMDPGDPDIMKSPPRNPKESFFSGGAGRQVILGGSLIGLLTVIAFWTGYNAHGYSPTDEVVPDNVHAYARTLAFMTIVCAQLFYALTFRNARKSFFQVGIFSNLYLIGAVLLGLILQLAVLLVPFMRYAFRLEMLDMNGWLTVIGLGLVPFTINEIGKALIRIGKKGRA